MTQINSQNRPICNKCQDRVALTYYQGLWICGECFAEYCRKQEKIKQKMILEG